MEYLQRLNESGPPQHMWSTIAPTSEESRLQEEEEGYEQLTNLEVEDIQASSTLSTQPTGSLLHNYMPDMKHKLISKNYLLKNIRQ